MLEKKHLGCPPSGESVQLRWVGLLDPRSDASDTLRDLVAMHQLHLDGMRDAVEIPHFLLPDAFLNQANVGDASSTQLYTFLKCRRQLNSDKQAGATRLGQGPSRPRCPK